MTHLSEGTICDGCHIGEAINEEGYILSLGSITTSSRRGERSRITTQIRSAPESVRAHTASFRGQSEEQLPSLQPWRIRTASGRLPSQPGRILNLLQRRAAYLQHLVAALSHGRKRPVVVLCQGPTLLQQLMMVSEGVQLCRNNVLNLVNNLVGDSQTGRGSRARGIQHMQRPRLRNKVKILNQFACGR